MFISLVRAKTKGEGLTLETSAFKSIYGGQFTTYQLRCYQIEVFHTPTAAATQSLLKLYLLLWLSISKLMTKPLSLLANECKRPTFAYGAIVILSFHRTWPYYVELFQATRYNDQFKYLASDL